RTSGAGPEWGNRCVRGTGPPALSASIRGANRDRGKHGRRSRCDTGCVLKGVRAYRQLSRTIQVFDLAHQHRYQLRNRLSPAAQALGASGGGFRRGGRVSSAANSELGGQPRTTLCCVPEKSFGQGGSPSASTEIPCCGALT